jgi:hypothetical protein
MPETLAYGFSQMMQLPTYPGKVANFARIVVDVLLQE